MAREKKKYRLIRGTHRVPNPDFVEGSDAEESHKIAEVGDIIWLTDDQFKAFKDKFAPLGSDATDVRDEDQEELDNAKIEAARTGENVNPNAPKDPFANARPASTSSTS